MSRPRSPIAFRTHRCYVLGHRLHHGMTGLILAAIGVALAIHDRRDFPFTRHD